MVLYSVGGQVQTLARSHSNTVLLQLVMRFMTVHRIPQTILGRPGTVEDVWTAAIAHPAVRHEVLQAANNATGFAFEANEGRFLFVDANQTVTHGLRSLDSSEGPHAMKAIAFLPPALRRARAAFMAIYAASRFR
jgi:hypothetical protein